MSKAEGNGSTGNRRSAQRISGRAARIDTLGSKSDDPSAVTKGARARSSTATQSAAGRDTHTTPLPEVVLPTGAPGRDAVQSPNAELNAALHAEPLSAMPMVDPNDRVLEEFGQEDYDRYFRAQARLVLDDGDQTGGADDGKAGTGQLVVLVASRFVADILRKFYGDVLGKICREFATTDVPALDPNTNNDLQLARELRFVVDSSKFGPSSSFAAEDEVRGRTSTARAAAPARASRATKRPVVAGRFTLDRFVSGNSNVVAYQAISNLIDAAAAEPGAVGVGGEVVFVHGPCGVGKTHLLQAAVARIRELRPAARVAYTTAEEFTNGFLTALRGGSAKLDTFRARYRRLDLLCIDDIHFLAGKKGTQKELLHTLEAIDLSGSRLAFASDHHPDELAQFSTPIMSRMRAGAVVGIDLPDETMRIDLIRHLALRRGTNIDMDAARVLAASAHAIGSSARELDGLVSQAEVRARIAMPNKNGLSIASVHINAEIARLVLATCGVGSNGYSSLQAGGSVDGSNSGGVNGDGLGRRRRPVRFAEILDAVCMALDVEIRDVHGRGRHPRVVLSRAMVTRLARRLTPMSYPEIARGLARTNHSTFITADKRLGGQIEQGLRLEQVHISGEPGLIDMELSTFEDVLADRIVRGVGIGMM